MEQILGDPSTKAAIMHLQAAVRARYGTEKGEGIGECALYINPDGVFLTDESCAIVAQGPAKVARALGRGRGRKAEGRGQRAEGRGQRAEGRGQK